MSANEYANRGMFLERYPVDYKSQSTIEMEASSVVDVERVKYLLGEIPNREVRRI